MPVGEEQPLTSSGAFIGRQQELHLLRARLRDAAGGRGGIVLLAGEPGIGKTRLSETIALEACAGIAGPAFQVLWGRCYEGEGAPAFWPWTQILRSCAAGSDPETLRREMGRGASDIAQLVPEVRERLDDLPESLPLETAQACFRLFESITTYFKNAGRRQPQLLILDDLHWADASSLVLLQFLARELRSTHLLIAGTYRDSEVSRQHPLSAAITNLSREDSCERIELRGLSELYLMYTTGTTGHPGIGPRAGDDSGLSCAGTGRRGPPLCEPADHPLWSLADRRDDASACDRGLPLRLPPGIRYDRDDGSGYRAAPFGP